MGRPAGEGLRRRESSLDFVTFLIQLICCVRWGPNHQIEAEIALLCDVRHPHINKLLAVSFNGPYRCLVLEYMEGGALDTQLRRPPMLQWHERMRILLHAALGLVHMHSLDPAVVHR